MAKNPSDEELKYRVKELEKESDEPKLVGKELRESKHYYRSLINHIHVLLA